MLVEELRLIAVGSVETACEGLRQLTSLLLKQPHEDQDLLQRITAEALGSIEGPLEMLGIDGGVALDQRVGQIALAREVIEERALGDAGPLDDLVDRGGGKPLLQDQVLRGIHDRGPRPNALPCHAALSLLAAIIMTRRSVYLLFPVGRGKSAALNSIQDMMRSSTSTG